MPNISKGMKAKKGLALFLVCSLVFSLLPILGVVPFGSNIAYAAVQATYYVAANGSDSNPGTLSQPFALQQYRRQEMS